ncbi:MAG: ACT domain-containing protein [Candidatus Thermoplasmatota archaeon]|jgi:predicted regulator of amino acid metabolism with ACT domain|nr:ACT domain-containing protein [Candidatus Sysuiplasma jiujiangense]MBX8638832.1 ACT domain-containing protein [Candidatus Sysuiplasma jiujiangense]MBX8641116.1 ACT domain-containing protein [Candidatus Sysuiplasma jiujiangense]MCL4317975.1 ACT domain-containing protein [Candidatus Thermoplasmatota archaeon]
MWEEIVREFGIYPSQSKVARAMLQLGLSVREGSIYCGEIRLSDAAIARALGVDRRVVHATAKTISESSELSKFFGFLKPVANLKDAGPQIGWSTIEITPDDADKPGILADVSRIIADAGISIRQAIVEDPELTENPRLYVVTSSEVPLELIPLLRRARGVSELTLK